MKSKLFCVAMALCMSFGVTAFAQMPNRGALTSKTGSRSLQRMHERGLVPKMWDDNRQWALDSTVMVPFNGDGSYRERVALSYNRTTRCISMRSRYTEGNNLSASIQNGAWDIFYDNNDMLFQRLTYDVNLNGVLTLDYCEDFSYDVDGKMIETVESFYDRGVKTNHRRCVYSYNSEGVLIEMLEYYWFQNSWLIESKFAYIYSEQGYLERSDYFYMNSGTNDWALRGFYMKEYVTDDHGNMLSVTISYHSGNYTNTWRDSFTYDAELFNNCLGLDAVMGYDAGDFNNRVISYTYSELANNGVTMNAIDHTTYHYSAAPVSVTEVERPEEKVYVAEGVIYLNEVKAVMLFTATGALVYSGETDRVEVSQGGVYLLRTAQGITKVMVW